MLKIFIQILFYLALSYHSNITFGDDTTSDTSTTNNHTVNATNSDGNTQDSNISTDSNDITTGGLGNLGDLINNSPSPLKDFLQGIVNLTCQTAATFAMTFRYEYANTCLPSPVFSSLVASTISPYFYQSFLVRLHMSDLPGNCDLSNRADPNNPKITFGLCSNTQLFLKRAEAFGLGIYNLVTGFITGNYDNAAKEFLKFINPTDFFIMYNNKSVDDNGFFIDIDFSGPLIYPVILPWKIITHKDAICVSTISFTGWMPVGCKYMFEPIPESIYQKILYSSESDSNATNSIGPNEQKSIALMQCSNAVGCFEAVKKNSFSLSKITSIVISCVNTMLVKMLVNESACVLTDIENVMATSSLKVDSVIYQFQENMRGFITGFLVLYIAFFGLSLILGKNFNQQEIKIALIKIILVTYFTLGIGGLVNGVRVEGMTSLIFPLLLTVPNEFASWIANAVSSGLCDFSNVTYTQGYEYLQLWDSMDCKLGHYIGFDMRQEFLADNFLAARNWNQFQAISFPVPPYIYLIMVGFYTGMVQLIIIALMYPILVISMITYVVQFFVVSMIIMTILGILSPIFIPMALFQFSYSYFTKWLRLFTSFALQPMIVVAFVTVAFSVFDRGLYGTCKFLPQTINIFGGGFYKQPAIAFTLDNNQNNYSEQDYNTCVNSLGYILQNPLAWAVNVLTKAAKGIFTGTFFTVLFDAIKNILLSMIIAIFTIYLIFKLSGQLSEFSASLAMSISIGGLVSSIENNFNTMMKAVAAVAAVASKAAAMRTGEASKALGGGGVFGSLSSGKMSEMTLTGGSITTAGSSSGAGSITTASSSSGGGSITTAGFSSGRGSITTAGFSSGGGSIPKASSSSAGGSIPTPSSSSGGGSIPTPSSSSGGGSIPTASSSSAGAVSSRNRSVPQIDFGPSKTPTVETIKNIIKSFHVDKQMPLFSSKEESLRMGGVGKKNTSFAYIEFSKYIANIAKLEITDDSKVDSTKSKKLEKFKEVYANTFSRYIKDNPHTKEHADELALKLENSLGGSSAQNLRDINNKILRELNISRTKTLN